MEHSEIKSDKAQIPATQANDPYRLPPELIALVRTQLGMPASPAK